ncbi:uncharacterized protein LOC125196117 [Salvia hispanica]|uniref:uncharacterized protein LOC125196117 n=1 Tax=Salvia hispanica TaxID=49212 RepID=UPI0020092995|nr:uncharacterized protein LOC125196117 [Salvia hispanica]XP_047950451.1 uncharacterized protein LOC125196117 [Salvia hispanica]XP_047950452.1 uncharacterized protein LOC125196117 [Salvia hispanica]XP_047950454.1 uncharacterized protein LOC125196117 [Salvia hispanica]
MNESRVDLAVEAPMVPKKDTLLQIANLDSGEMLDFTAAKPLLTSIQPEAGHSNEETLHMPTPAAATLLPPPSAAFVPPFDEFPPLERGITLKLRDAFEKAMPNPRPAVAGPRKKTEGPAYRNSLIAGSPSTAGERPSTNLIDPRQPKGHEEASGNSSKPKTMADLLRGKSDLTGPQVFEPEKIQNIGKATLSIGIPAIYFSGVEIQKLVGHAIVVDLGNTLRGRLVGQLGSLTGPFLSLTDVWFVC